MQLIRRYIQLLLVTVFLLLSQFITAENGNSSEKYYYKTRTELNVRKGAGKHYAILFTLQKGDSLRKSLCFCKFKLVPHSQNISHHFHIFTLTF